MTRHTRWGEPPRGVRSPGPSGLPSAGLGTETATASGLTSPTASTPVEPGPESSAAVDEYARPQLDELSLPGLALTIVHDGQVVHVAGFGHADPTGRPVTPQTPS